MENPQGSQAADSPSIQATRVFATIGIYLMVGLVVGYVLRGTIQHSPPTSAAMHSAPSASGTAAHSTARMPTLAEMKHMADTQAAPLLEKLKSDPNNGDLLVQVGGMYHAAHQYKEASTYFGRAVQIDPKNVTYLTKLALSLYRSGDADGAIAELNKALRNDPKDANALFDLGMIRMEGKHDSKGALAAWQKLLKSNPDLSPDRKAAVMKLIADAMTSLGNQNPAPGEEQ